MKSRLGAERNGAIRSGFLSQAAVPIINVLPVEREMSFYEIGECECPHKGINTDSSIFSQGEPTIPHMLTVTKS